MRPLDTDDARAVSRLPHVTGMTAVVWGNTEIKANGRLRRSIVYGQSADMPNVYRMKLSSGQFLPDDESESARAFVVLGAKLKTELFGAESALGERANIATIVSASSASWSRRGSSSASTSTIQPTSRQHARWNSQPRRLDDHRPGL